MVKKVFFSFHYQDVIDFRANVVRNHWLTKKDHEDAGFFDASIWESVKKTSDLAVKRLINNELKNTSVTCVLVGSHTFERRWVDYEIMKSLEKGNKIFGVHINGIKDKNGQTKSNGPNPFYYLGFSYDNSGKNLLLHNYINGKWKKYSDLEGWSVSEIDEKKRNIVFRLSTIYPIYDWVKNDGYNNFTDWVE